MNDPQRRDAYFMRIAETVALGTNCSSHNVGALIVKDGDIVAAGYLATPAGVTPCNQGGCPGCASGDRFGRLCLCVHAEENALLAAARHGIAVAGGTCYGTHKPCLECLKKLMHAGITRIVYGTARPRDEAYMRSYDALVARHGIAVEQLAPQT